MTETDRTVQVPASLPTREQIGEVLWKHETPGAVVPRDGWIPPNFLSAADKVLALLSQPSPTAEPPRIEDLAPGTTFIADTIATRYGSRWTVLPSGRVESGMGIGHEASEIDPSTIRDVTPPAVTE